jgi:hypothetical protein
MDSLRLTCSNVLHSDLKLDNWTETKWQDSNDIGMYNRVVRVNDGTIKLTYNAQLSYFNVEFSSLPTIFKGSSLSEINVSDLPIIYDSICDLISEYTTVSLENYFIISRVDNSIILETEHKPYLYLATLNSVTPQKLNRMQKAYFENQTLRFSNNNKCNMLYDKIAKCEKGKTEKDYSLDHTSSATNMLRIENQYRNTEQVNKGLGTQRIGLKQLFSDETYDKMKEQRIYEFDNLFKDVSKDQIKAGLSIAAFLNETNDSKKRSINDLMMFHATQTITEDEFKAQLQTIGTSRQTIITRMKDYRRVKSIQYPVTDIFDELRTKIIEHE